MYWSNCTISVYTVCMQMFLPCVGSNSVMVFAVFVSKVNLNTAVQAKHQHSHGTLHCFSVFLPITTFLPNLQCSVYGCYKPLAQISNSNSSHIIEFDTNLKYVLITSIPECLFSAFLYWWIYQQVRPDSDVF